MPKLNNLIQQLEKPLTNKFIYGLLDPDTNELRYIGQTLQGFRRIREHYNHCEKRTTLTKKLTYSQNWIKSLKKQDKIFKVIYLEYCDNSNKLNELEIFYINYFKSLNCKLTNIVSGGSQKRSKEHSQLTKNGMNNPITKERMKNRRKAIHTNKGRKFSQEFKNKISLAQELKVRYIQDENGNIYRGLKAAARGLNVTFGTIWKCLNGDIKTVKGQHLIEIERKKCPQL